MHSFIQISEAYALISISIDCVKRLKMVTKFVRPKDSLYPLIYHTFKAKSLEGDDLVEYYIQDLTESHYEKAVELLIKNFMPEESFQMAINLAGLDFAAEIYRIYYTPIFQERCSLGCFVSGTHELVGVDAMKVKNKGGKEEVTVRLACLWPY